MTTANVAGVQPDQQIYVQTGDLDESRWSDLRSDLVQVLAGLCSKLGFNMIADENLLKMGFPVEDNSRFEDGRLDVDFEESAIEALLKMQREGLKFAEICQRFAHNLQVRNHEPLQMDEAESDANG